MVQLPTPEQGSLLGAVSHGEYPQDFTCLFMLFPRLKVFAPNVRLSAETPELGT